MRSEACRSQLTTSNTCEANSPHPRIDVSGLTKSDGLSTRGRSQEGRRCSNSCGFTWLATVNRPAMTRRGSLPLEKHIEIHSKPSLEIAKENAVSGIGSICMHVQRVEVVGQIETAQRKPQGVILSHFEIFRDSYIK
jgi:hypothetical protein